MKSVIKFTVFFILPIAAFILWIGGFFSERIPAGYAQVAPKVITNLKVEELKSTPIYQKIKIDGYITSKDTAKVATKLMGKIYKIKVNEGDYVKKGQILAIVDHSDINAQKEELNAALKELKAGKEEALAGKKAAQAQYEFAKITLKRIESLYMDNAVPKQKYDEVKMRYEAAKAQLEQVDAKLKQLEAKEAQLNAKLKQINSVEKYAFVRAPFDGYVIKKIANEGDMANPGMPLFVIGSNKIQFQSNIDVKYLPYVKKEQLIDIHIESLNKDVKAKISEINPNSNPYNNSFSIKADINERFPVGLYAVSYIQGKKYKKLLIPETAVVRLNNITSVYIVDESGILHLIPITLGEKYGDKYEVKSGIYEGQKVIIDGTEKACDGCRITF